MNEQLKSATAINATVYPQPSRAPVAAPSLHRAAI